GRLALGRPAALVAITPNDDFYVITKGATPYLGASKWRLKVDGLVASPFTLTYDELLKLPRIEKTLSNPFPITWSFWRYLWVNPQPGAYKIRGRAIDGRGKVQDW